MAEVLEAPTQTEIKPKRRLVYDEHQRVGEWLAERTDGEWRKGGKCIGLERGGEIIAGVLYDWHNGASIYTHIAIDPHHIIDRDFLWHIFYYPFVQLGCNVLIGLVAEGNTVSRRFVEHLGFTLHSTIPQAHPTGSIFLYTMYREYCRWLKLRGEIH